MPDPVTLSIPATEGGLAALRAFVEHQASALGMATTGVCDLVVATHEIAANIVAHGYRGAPGTIELAIIPEGGKVLVRLRDHAPPFDPTQAPVPDVTRPIEQRAPGGLGIQLARRFTDALEYRRTAEGGNEMTLIKRHDSGVEARGEMPRDRMAIGKEEPMDISTLRELREPPVTVLRVTGPITESAALIDQAQAAFDKGSRHMLIDMSKVPYMATAGLRALHAIYMLLREAAGADANAVGSGIVAGTYTSPHLKLLSPNAPVMEALKTAGYDMFLQIHTNYQQALDSFQ